MADNNNVKFFSNGRPCLAIKKPKLLRKKNEEGSFLIEVLVAGTILLMLAASAVTHLTTLNNVNVRTEARDKALVLINSLHETMQSAGCGLDVSVAKEGSGATPWDRVGSCAFKAIQNNLSSPVANTEIDEDGHLYFTGATPDLNTIANFCAAKGEANGGINKCELGDQDYQRTVLLNNSGTEVLYQVHIRYWFEKTGVTDPSTVCGPAIANAGMPNVIARSVTLTWDIFDQTETINIVKRQNVPADSIEFSSSARVGVYLTAPTETMTLSYVPSSGPARTNFMVTRKNDTNTFPGAKCLWFPYIDKNSYNVLGLRPSFTANPGKTFDGIPNLTNEAL